MISGLKKIRIECWGYYQSGVSIEAARKFRKDPQHCWIEVRNP
jgi:hypothetical protein